jgi:hypothetical protein
LVFVFTVVFFTFLFLAMITVRFANTMTTGGTTKSMPKHVFCSSVSCLVLSCALLVWFSALPMMAQYKVPTSYYLPGAEQGITYNSAVPTPEQFFGFQVGEWHLRPDQVMAYMRELARTSNRVQIEQYALSHERNPLMLLTISDQKNLARLADIKAERARLRNPAQSGSVSIATMPIVVWMGYSVHGNEPSGMNASPMVAYYLAAAQGAGISAQLENTVVLFDPSINPDGGGRFAHWANTNRSMHPQSDPQSREHSETWPGGRFNHYWFDLNRDWFPVQHPESRGRIIKFQEWMPNVLTDHHEMGTNSTFFFQPGIPTRNNPNTPKRNYELTDNIAQFHVKVLDSAGILYYSRENFDDYYVGKGSSYPDVQGSVGILFEQGSSRGHIQSSMNGDLAFTATIRNQVLTSLSTFKAANIMREDLLKYQQSFFKQALADAQASSVKAYIVGGSPDIARTQRLAAMLQAHSITLHRPEQTIKLGGTTYTPENSFIVPTAQAQYRLITAVFERRTQFEDSLFYDISSWTLPYAFGLPFAEMTTQPALGKPMEAISFDRATPKNPRGQWLGTTANEYAYLIRWNQYFAPKVIYRLADAGIKVRVALQKFTSVIPAGAQGTSTTQEEFEPGTIAIPLALATPEQKTLIRSILTDAVENSSLMVYGIATGYTPQGIDIGSRNFEAVDAPRIALLAGEGVTATDAGEIWHLLDERFGIDVSILDMAQFNRINLNKYTVLVMPNGSYATVSAQGKESLKQFIERGGTVVAMENAVSWLMSNDLAKGRLRSVSSASKSANKETRTTQDNAPSIGENNSRRMYSKIADDDGADEIGGAIFNVALDRTHPICFGYDDDQMPWFRSNKVFLEPSANPYSTPILYTAKPLLSGFTSQKNLALIQSSAAITTQTLRLGRIILMADNPNFRAFWYGTNKVFLNALFFGNIIQRGGGADEE